MASSADDFFHREPVNKVAWVRNPVDARVGGRSFQLASVSGDGKLLFWELQHKLAFFVEGAALKPTRGYAGHESVLQLQDAGGQDAPGDGGSDDPAGFEASGGSGWSSSPSSAASLAARYAVMGGTALAFSPLDWNSYVVGTECGGVLRGLQNTKLDQREKHALNHSRSCAVWQPRDVGVPFSLPRL